MSHKSLNNIFSDLKVIELSSVLAGPSVGLFFLELGADVIKIENKITKGDVTRSWKLKTENKKESASAYYWSVNAGKKTILMDFKNPMDLNKVYELIKHADILITNFKTGDDIKLKLDYKTVKKINTTLIYASISGFGSNVYRTAYDLILQAESGFMFMNGEKQSPPLKMPVAMIDILAAHQLKEAILISLLQRFKSQVGSHVTVSLFDAAIASLANQATNWLIANDLPQATGSLHPNIAPYGEIFSTKDNHQITFAIGSTIQFTGLLDVLGLPKEKDNPLYVTNQLRVKNRELLFSILNNKIKTKNFQPIYKSCIANDIPIGKIRNLKEVFELPMAKNMIKKTMYRNKTLQTVKSIAFQVL
jgi:crotonobetainyl-CoA:carnitine CoA-transferase CaiB-like acyl-CoA transferase